MIGISMTKKLLVLIFLLLLFLTACSVQENNDVTSKEDDTSVSQNTQIKDNITSNEEDSNMLETLNKLVDDNYICITKLFYFGHLPYGDVEMDGDIPFAKIDSEEFKTYDDIKRFLEGIYVQEEVDRLLNNYFEGQPLYFDKDGILYLYLDQASNAGMPIGWKDYSIEIVDESDDRCVFEVTAEYIEDELRVGDDEGKYTFVAINNNGWRLETAVSDPHM